MKARGGLAKMMVARLVSIKSGGKEIRQTKI